MNSPLPIPPREDESVTLLVVPDCPNATPAAQLFVEVLAEQGVDDVAVHVEVVDDPQQAAERGFIGSPSFFMDGVDLFAVAGASTAIACRTYRTASGLSGLPDRTALAAAIRAHHAGSPGGTGERSVR